MVIDIASEPPRQNLFGWLRGARKREEEQSRNNQFVLRALAEEKRDGQRIAVIARTAALGVIAALLPFLNPTISVLYYEVFTVGFVAIGWAQLRFARVGRSGTELALIFLDLALLTFLAAVPNPFVAEDLPTAFSFRFGAFIYFFVFLAVGTLAYSWRTVLSIGTWVAALWVAAALGVAAFGHQNTALGETASAVFSAYPDILHKLDPNSVDFPMRVQEIVVFVIVAGILGLKGRRSNELLMKQAMIAAERANLSRYFSPNMVDVLASNDHDVGAVRSQDAAVMFIDIVGFTQLSERSEPRQIMDLLRRYLSLVEAAIFDHGGTLDKYLGDGVMATFGTPQTRPQDAVNALKAARQIVEGMEEFNRDSLARGAPSLQVSIGLHFGAVIIGDVGPSRRLEFAVLGDTVNVASRLESASRELRCRMVASDAVIERVRMDGGDPSLLAGLTAAQSVALRGRTAPIDVWTC